MKVLFIAPFPPPITGHSLAAEVFHDDLARTHETAMVNLSLGSANDGSVSGRRIREVGKVLAQVWRRRADTDAVYLTISESVAGNIKDLAIYLLCADRLSRTYLHLHGGSIKKLLFDRHPLLRRLNALAIGRMGGVIVSGRSHEHIFAGMIAPERIHIVPNFARDELFVTEEAVSEKFADVTPLRVLYLSGMTGGKGYLDLVAAVPLLSAATAGRIEIDFAGKFDTAAEEEEFLARIATLPSVRYHGLVSGERKRELFARAHVFCLPTTMFEGQPISILEAYASGCVAVVTGQDGIRDVFTQGINGCEVEPGAPASIAAVLDRAVAEGAAPLLAMALENRRQAETGYRTATFGARLRAIIEGAGTTTTRPAVGPATPIIGEKGT